jgi:hypothetical protein
MVHDGFVRPSGMRFDSVQQLNRELVREGTKTAQNVSIALGAICEDMRRDIAQQLLME